MDKFKDNISNDLNTSMMITTIYDVLKDDNLNDNSKRYLIGEFDKVLGLDLLKQESKSLDVSEELIKEKIALRDEAKKAKNYSLADSIRDELYSMGIKLIDTSSGTKYEIL